MSFSEDIKSLVAKLLDKLGTALATAFSATIVFVMACLGRPVVDTIAAASTKELLLRIVALLTFVLLLGAAYVLYLLSEIRKPLSSKYDFDISSGFYIDRKTKRGVCACCLAKNITTYLMESEINGKRHCMVCKTLYLAPAKESAM